MSWRVSLGLAASVTVVACGGIAPATAGPDGATVTFCVPHPDSTRQPAEGQVIFLDTLRIVADGRDSRMNDSQADSTGVFVTSRTWFWERDPITFDSTSYFVWGPIIVARGAAAGESGYVIVKYATHDGIPFYAYAEQMPEPSLLLTPEGLPCRLLPYMHEANVR